jgi:hypothetical protein
LPVYCLGQFAAVQWPLISTTTDLMNEVARLMAFMGLAPRAFGLKREPARINPVLPQSIDHAAADVFSGRHEVFGRRFIDSDRQ